MSNATRDYVMGKIHKLKAQAQDILDENERLGKDETPEQLEQIKGITAEIQSLTLEVKTMDDREEMRKSLESLGTISEIASPDTEPVEAKSLGEAFVRSAEYQALSKSSGPMPRFRTPPIELKAAGDPPILIGSGDNADALRPAWDPTLRAPGLFQAPLRIADLLPVTQADGSPVYYPKVAIRTAPSGNPTAEGADKKEVGFGFEQGMSELVKNTAYTKVSEEFFRRAAALMAYIDNQMRLMVLQDEETQIYTALTTDADTVDGTEIGGDNGFDAIRSAITVVQLNGGTANGVVIHPNDAAYLDVQRAVAGDGAYFSGGPFGGPRSSVWGGLRYVISTSAEEGTALVGDFSLGATLYREGGLRADSSNSDGDNFRKNLISLRAELYSVCGVHNPELFVQASVGSS